MRLADRAILIVVVSGLWLSAGCDRPSEPPAIVEQNPVDVATPHAVPAERLELQLARPWSASILETASGSLIAAISHRDNYLDVWSVDKARVAASVSRVETGYHPDSVRWLDWTGDGQVRELLVAVEGPSLVQLWQLTDEGLVKLIETSVEDPPRTAQAADLDGNGRPDLILGPYDDERITILWNDGENAFTQDFLPAARMPSYPTLVDWNGDGHLDIAWSAWIEGSVMVALNQGERAFVIETLHQTDDAPRQTSTGDLDGDGMADLIIALEVRGARVLYNDGQGGIARIEEIPAPVAGYSAVGIDHQADGAMLALSDSGVLVLARPLDTGWQLRQFETRGIGYDLQFADVDGDGHQDLLFANSGGDEVEVIFGPLWEKAAPLELGEES